MQFLGCYSVLPDKILLLCDENKHIIIYYNTFKLNFLSYSYLGCASNKVQSESLMVGEGTKLTVIVKDVTLLLGDDDSQGSCE